MNDSVRLPHYVTRRTSFGYSVKRVDPNFGAEVLGSISRVGKGWQAQRASGPEFEFIKFPTKRAAVAWLTGQS